MSAEEGYDAHFFPVFNTNIKGDQTFCILYADPSDAGDTVLQMPVGVPVGIRQRIKDWAEEQDGVSVSPVTYGQIFPPTSSRAFPFPLT